MTKYGRSPWIDRFPKSRVPAYPRYRGQTGTSVVVIGGGLTGCATAYGLAAAGTNVVLLEAGQIGHGVTAASSGVLGVEPGPDFAAVEKALGLRAARRAFQAWRRAALDFAALARRLDLKCHLEARDMVTVAMRAPEAAPLARELKARRAAGLDGTSLPARALAADLGLSAAAGMKLRDASVCDPYRACVGLAAAAAERGADLFEHSPVTKITFTRKDATVFTDRGQLRTRRIVVALGTPTPLFKPLVRHFWFRTAYCALTEPIPARIRRQIARTTAVVRDLATPPHLVRWADGDRLLVVGADQETPPARLAEKAVVQRTGQLMYELSTLYPDISGVLPDYGWHAPYALTADGLPCIGVHRNYPHHIFALADASHGVTGSYLASRIALRAVAGEADPADQVFGFLR